VGATWHAFTDPLGWFLFWVQFLYFRVWYMWDFQFMLLILPLPFGWVEDDELKSLFGWLGEWYVAEKSISWLGYTITIVDLFFTLFLTEAIVLNIMDKAAKKNGIDMSCKFGALQTFAHLLLAVFTLIPAVVLLWVGLFEEFLGRARTFKETPKASMTVNKDTQQVAAAPLVTENSTPEEDEVHVYYREKTTSRSSRSNATSRATSRVTRPNALSAAPPPIVAEQNAAALSSKV